MSELFKPLIPNATLWIPNDVLPLMRVEATRTAPLETGGVILGYWSNGNNEVIISHMIGPGPGAIHEKFRFEPDYSYQEMEIERLYEESGRHLHYLGDWHSHPSGGGNLSWQDIKVCRKIACFKQARAKKPVMLILSGLADWRPFAWQCEISRQWLLWSKTIVSEMQVRQYARDLPMN